MWHSVWLECTKRNQINEPFNPLVIQWSILHYDIINPDQLHGWHDHNIFINLEKLNVPKQLQNPAI